MDRHHRRGGSRRLLTRVVGLAALTAAFAGASAAPALADLTITKDGPATAAQGSQFDYGITVANAAATDATNVVVTDNLPAGVSFVSLGSTPGCSVVANAVTCSVGTVAGTGSVPLTIKVRADSLGTQANTASVTSNPADADTANNTSNQVTTEITDRTPPDTDITGGPSGLTNQVPVSFTFTSTEPTEATFVCSIDTGAFSACTSGQQFPGLGEGAHTFSVKARDAALNEDPMAATRSFTIDTIAPDTTITGGPSGPVQSSTATFSFSSEPGATFVCTLRGSTPCESGVPFAGLPDGTYVFGVAARDAAGNTDGTPAEQTFTVDTAEPVVGLDAVPLTGSGATSDTTPTFGGAAGNLTGDLGVEVEIFAGGAATGTPVRTLTATRTGATYTATPATPLDPGEYTALAKQVDYAGNIGESVDKRTFIVDTGAPAVGLDAVALTGPGATNDATPTLTGAAGNAAGDDPQVMVDIFAGETATGSPQRTLPVNRTGATYTATVAAGSPLTDGTYTARARQTDYASNPGVSAPVTFTVDTIAPDTTITLPPAPVVSSQSQRFTFTSTEPNSTFRCAVDGAAPSPCASGDTFTAPTDGDHVFSVQAVDRAGNVDAAAATQAYKVDSVAPVVTLEQPTEGTVLTTRRPTFSGGAGMQPGDQAEVAVELYRGTSIGGGRVPETVRFAADHSGGAWTVTLSSFDPLPDGRYTARARQRDEVNAGFSTPVTFVVDTQGPDTTITDGPTGPVASTAATFAFTADEADSTYECRLDGGPFAACTSPQRYSGLSEGRHTFEVRSIDAVENRDPSPAARTWSVAFPPDLPAPAPAPAALAPDLTGSSDPGARFATKLQILRSRVLRRERKLDVLAPLSRRAGGEAEVSFQSAGQTVRFRETPKNGRLRFQRTIPAEQARLGTGILTIRYAGDDDTRGEEIRLRAASRAARLDAGRPQIRNGRLTAKGLVSPLARGVVRIRLDYVSGDEGHAPEFTAPIANGRYALDVALPAAVRDGIANREGTVHSSTFFTGYQARRMRGEMASLEVLPFR